MIELGNKANYADCRQKNPAAIAPDKGFTKQIKKLNPNYEVVWDSLSELWEIWEYPKDNRAPFHVLTISGKNKTYRELGQDVILRLTEYSWTRFSAKELADYFDEMDNQVRRRKMRDFRNKIESITLENVDAFRGVTKIVVPRQYSIERMVSNG